MTQGGWLVVMSERKLAKRLLAGCIAAALAAGFAGCGGSGGGLSDGYYKTVLVKTDGSFAVDDKVSDSDAAKSGLVYKVEMGKDKEKGKVKSITAMYGGAPIDAAWKSAVNLGSDRFASVKMEYSDDGFTKYTFLNERNVTTNGLYRARSVRFKVNDQKQVTAAYLYNKDGENKTGEKGMKNPVAQLLFSYDQDNRVKEIRFANQNGDLVPAAQYYGGTAVGLAIKYNENKKERIDSLTWKSKDGNTVKGMDWASELYTYDDQGRVTEVKHTLPDGSAVKKVSYDFNLYNPEAGKDFGGILSYLDKIRQARVYGSYSTKFVYKDKDKMPSQVLFIGSEGQAAATYNGMSDIRVAYDKLGNIVKVESYGTDGQLKPFAKKNVDTMEIKYDGKGNVSDLTFFHGADPTPINMNGKESNVAGKHYAYDDVRRLTSVSYTDVTGAPAFLRRYGAKYSKVLYSYDGEGKVTRSYYTEDGTELSADDHYGLFYGTWESKDYRFILSKDKETFIRKNDNEVVTDGKYTLKNSSVSQFTGLGTVTMDSFGKDHKGYEDTLRLVSEDVLEFNEVRMQRVKQ